MLILPAEAADAGLARRLEDGNLDRLPVNPPLAGRALSRGNVQQSTVVNRLHEAVSESVERGAQSPDVLGDRYVLLCFRNDGTVIENGAPLDGRGTVIDRDHGIDEVAVFVVMADPQLRELARSAAHRVLMALGTRASVEDGSQSRGYIVLRLVDLLISREGVARRLREAIAGAFGTWMRDQRRSVKAGRRFGRRWCGL